jgi:hypothetical protein
MAPATPTLTVAFVARLVAKDDTADEVAAFLTDAVQLANDERLLAAPPEILPADILAAKAPSA